MKRSKFTTVLGACLAVSMMASACSSKKDGKSAKDTKKAASKTSEITEVTDESETDPKKTKETMTSETTKDTDSTTASTAESTTEKETGAGETTLWELDDSLKFEDHIPTYTSSEVERPATIWARSAPTRSRSISDDFSRQYQKETL